MLPDLERISLGIRIFEKGTKMERKQWSSIYFWKDVWVERHPLWDELDPRTEVEILE